MMVRLNKKYGKLVAGKGVIINHDTPEKIILSLLKRKPEMKVYFEGFEKKKKDGSKDSKKESST